MPVARVHLTLLLAATVLVAITTGAAGPAVQAVRAVAGTVRELPPMAAAGSGMYHLTTAADGTPYLAWLEPLGGTTHALKFAVLRRGRWSRPREIARGDDWFVNWADHPSLAVLADGTLAAHWLVHNPAKAGSYGYGFRIALSRDSGATWRVAFAGGTENTSGYSGFVSLLPAAEGVEAIYLGPPSDGAAAGVHAAGGAHDDDHTMMLASVTIGRDGRVLREAVADANSCSCCSTAIVKTSRGVLAAYRDRADGEIRDISVVQLRDGVWGAPRSVHQDGWQINACPTNGPALGAAGVNVVIAWFTGAGGVPRLKAAFSSDAGTTFRHPVVLDGGRPVGWPALALLDDGSAVVSWLESHGDGRGDVRLRRVWPDGRTGVSHTVAVSSSGRSTGIPQMVRSGDSLVLAWRTDRVRAAVVPIPTR